MFKDISNFHCFSVVMAQGYLKTFERTIAIGQYFIFDQAPAVLLKSFGVPLVTLTVMKTTFNGRIFYIDS